MAQLANPRGAVLVGGVAVAVALAVVVAALVLGDGRGSGPAGQGAGDSGSLVSGEDAEATLRDYLGALSGGDFDSAATLLVAGDQPLAERSDLATLGLDELTVEAVAAALAAFCEPGCVEATDVTVDGPAGPGTGLGSVRGYRVTAGFGEPRGHPVERSFEAGRTPDGEPYVRGLPPPDLSPIPTTPS